MLKHLLICAAASLACTHSSAKDFVYTNDTDKACKVMMTKLLHMYAGVPDQLFIEKPAIAMRDVILSAYGVSSRAELEGLQPGLYDFSISVLIEARKSKIGETFTGEFIAFNKAASARCFERFS